MPGKKTSLGAHTRHLLGRVRRYIREPLIMLAEWGFAGAQIVGSSPSGNTLLRLSRNYELGARGTILELPRDRVIFESVRQGGSYSPEISKFLSDGLEAGISCGQHSAVIDIGANSGLVSLQTMNMVDGICDYYLFEPLPEHVAAIRRNLSSASHAGEVHIYDIALAGENGTTEFYTERMNFGNSSVLQDAIVNQSEQMVTTVKTRDTNEAFQAFVHKPGRFVLKSDTQGMDAFILSRIPLEVWEKIDRAAVEVLALPDVDPRDVKNLLGKIAEFRVMSWDSDLKSSVSIHEIEQFWTEGNCHERNLFLVR